MGQGIFIIQPNGSLLQLNQTPYDSELILQELLAKYPNLLSGDDVESGEPTRWLLVKQEMGVQNSEYSGDRWSLDHLFLDQNSVPTFVEVKRASDTRIRREVVGQMLDYAANAMAYWPVNKIRETLENTLIENDLEITEILDRLMGNDIDQSEYWKRVETNLHSGRVRLIFVADEIPRELRRIIEFLNQQMSPAEVFGIEIKQFKGEGISSLVPHIVGMTADAEIRKSSGKTSSKQWDKEMFFEFLENRGNENEIANAKQILDWAINKNLRIWWGAGAKAGSFYVMYDRDQEKYYTFNVTTGYTTAYIQLQFGYYKAPFNSYEKKRELADKIGQATGKHISDEKLEKFPSVELGSLDNMAIQKLLNVFDEYLSTYKDMAINK